MGISRAQTKATVLILIKGHNKIGLNPSFKRIDPENHSGVFSAKFVSLFNLDYELWVRRHGKK